MVEGDQSWSRSAQGQYRTSYTEHDAAIDRAIAETYGGASATLREGDGNRQAAQKSETRTSKASTFSQSSTKRDKPRGQSASRINTGRGRSEQAKVGTEKEKWIHRDKLALIEVQEYRELGLEPPPELLRRLAASRAETSRDDAEALRRIKTPEPQEYEDAQEILEDEPESYQQHDDDQETVAREPYTSEDPRAAEEAAAETRSNGKQSPRYQASGLLRKSHSRLPVSSSSNGTSPQDSTDKDGPLQRKRGASNAGEGDGIGYPKVRNRKGSVGSQAMLDDEPSTPTSATFSKSANKSRTTSSSKQREKGKGKFNTISTVPQTRSTSTGRPGTAGDGRPRTATNPPEGDPPWLTGMYKPDPRLPPDQQMLPTHARRLAQEQWEKDGKNANTYDRDFNPLTNFDDENESMALDKARAKSASPEKANDIGRESALDGVHERHLSPESPVKAESPVKENVTGLGIESHPDGEWPLTSSRTPSPTKKRTNGGGYSTIPRLTDSPKPAVGLFPSPRPGDQPAEAQRPVTRHGAGAQYEANERLGLETRVTGGVEDPEKGQTEKKRGGACGCCVVM